MLYWYISFFHNVPYKKGIANQSFSITAIFASSPQRKERCVTRQTAVWGTNSLRAQPVIVSSRKVPSLKRTKELLHQSARIRLTCRHNNTKLCFYTTKVATTGKKYIITKITTFAPCSLQSIFVECYFKKIETATKLKTSPIRIGA